MNKLLFILSITSLLLSSCSYQAYVGSKLEKQHRYEEANIAYHKAYVQSWFGFYKTAYLRTSKAVSTDMLQRYHRYLEEGQYAMAYNRLKRVINLTPKNQEAQKELTKWTQVLLSGKVDFHFKNQRRANRFPVADKLNLKIEINTPNNEVLEAKIDIKYGVFKVEDMLYKMKLPRLLHYTIRGIELETQQNGSFNEKIPFIFFGNPKLQKMSGTLKAIDIGSKKMIQANSLPKNVWINSKARSAFSKTVYSLLVQGNRIRVLSKAGASFLPAAIYLNQENQHAFLNFNTLIVADQTANQNKWTIQRGKEDKDYITFLKKYYTLWSYFSYKSSPFYIEE